MGMSADSLDSGDVFDLWDFRLGRLHFSLKLFEFSLEKILIIKFQRISWFIILHFIEMFYFCFIECFILFNSGAYFIELELLIATIFSMCLLFIFKAYVN